MSQNMTTNLERRLRGFNPDDYMTQAECAREALAELSEVLGLRGMARRNAASKFLSDFEATLRSALSSADEITRLRAENERLERAAVIAVLPLEALLLVGNVREQHSPELWEGIEEGAQAVRAALKGSRHE